MTPRHDELAALAEGFVLGTLPEAEMRRFAAHLPDCADCARLVREYEGVSEAIARGLPPQAPPPGLRDRVIANAVGQTQVDPPETPAGREHATRVVPAWLAVAAAVVAVVMGVAAWQFRQEAQVLRSDVQAAAARAAALEQQVQQLRADAATASRTGAILSAQDLARIELAGQEPAPAAAGRVFWSPTFGLVFAATNLPALPPGRVYQLWIVADKPISAGIARPTGDGGFNVVAGATGATGAAGAAVAKAFALTIEPEGGRPAPTGAMFLLGTP
jgi:anti-sigma-K factor RskA